MTNASIVVHKSPVKQLEKVLECLNLSSVDIVYVIDNSPTDVLKKIAERFPKVEYYHVVNKGFGAGHNVAIKKSLEHKSDYHLVLNADVWWDGDIIKELEKYMEDRSNVGLVSAKTFYPSGELQFTCRMLPTPTDMFIRAFFPVNWMKKKMNRYLLEDLDHDKEINSPYLLGSFMFFKMEALRDVGLFDETFFMYPEDIDITRRMHKKWETIYWPGVSIVHEHQQDSKKNLRMFNIHLFNMIKYFNKWGWFLDAERKRFNKALRE